MVDVVIFSLFLLLPLTVKLYNSKHLLYIVATRKKSQIGKLLQHKYVDIENSKSFTKQTFSILQ